jgi:putative transcriptional regulator
MIAVAGAGFPAFAGPVGAADTPRVDVANGVFLVAKPDLQDPNFRESVVLITQPRPDGGPLGVIVNRPLGIPLREALSSMPGAAEVSGELYFGGPVSRNRLLFAFRSTESPADGFRVLDDLWLSGDGLLLARLLRAPGHETGVRVYSGYSGWAPGQLQREIERGGWYLLAADPAIVFSATPGAVWAELVRRMTRRTTMRPPIVPESRRAPVA